MSTWTWLDRVSPDYFKTMGTPLLAGRDFNDRDTASSPKVAIVNQLFANQFFGGANPIGKTFQLEEPPGKPRPFYQVVGLIKDTKYNDLRGKTRPIAYLPDAQDEQPGSDAAVLIRSNISLVSLISSIKRTVNEINPEISLDFHVFSTQIKESLLRERLMATLAGFFGLLAGLLATIGLYGVISYMVVRRTNEIGIRMALGADRLRVLKLVMREAGMLLAIGVVAGTALAFIAGSAASAMIYGLKPRDPLTFALAIALLGAVAAAASYLPAQRAARLDPMLALRDE
jgi:predicted permease